MSDTWHYTHDGEQRGPVSPAELKRLAATGGLEPDDKVWREGMEKWVPARTIKGMFAVPAVPPTKAPPPLPRRNVPLPADPLVEGDAGEGDGPGKGVPAGPLEPVLRTWRQMPMLARAGVAGGGLLALFALCGGILFIGSRLAGPAPLRMPGFATDEEKVKVEIDIPKADFSGVDYARGPAGEDIESRKELAGTHKVEAQGFKRGGRFVYHGTVTEWYRDGKQKFGEAKYANGKKHGPLTNWFPDGRKKLEEGHVDGKLEGYSASWYADGTKRHEAVFSKGRHVGQAVDYHESGRKRRLRNYADGRREGKTILWRQDGSRLREMAHAGGQLQGDRWFTPDGAEAAGPPIRTMSAEECVELIRETASGSTATGTFSWPRATFIKLFGEPGVKRGDEWEYPCLAGKVVLRVVTDSGLPSAPLQVAGLSLYRDGNGRTKDLSRAEFKKKMLALRDEWSGHPVNVIVPWAEMLDAFGGPNAERHTGDDRRTLTYRCKDGEVTLDVKASYRPGPGGQTEYNLAIIEKME